MTLRDQHVLITGGSSGIGLALGQQAAAAGARVSLVARDPAKLASGRAAIRAAVPGGAEVVTVTADVSIEAEILAALQAAEKVHGPVEVLITSAGVARPGHFTEVPVSVFERTMAVNYFGTLYPLKAVVPAMRRRGHGAVVLISSGAGLVGLFGYTPYGELKDTGVSVTIVYPPDTDTPQLIEENLTKPVETKALTAAGGLWTAEAVARVTLAGVQRGRFAITPGFQLTVLACLHSVIAPVVNWHFDRLARKARRAAATDPS